MVWLICPALESRAASRNFGNEFKINSLEEVTTDQELYVPLHCNGGKFEIGLKGVRKYGRLESYQSQKSDSNQIQTYLW